MLCRIPVPAAPNFIKTYSGDVEEHRIHFAMSSLIMIHISEISLGFHQSNIPNYRCAQEWSSPNCLAVHVLVGYQL